MSSMTLCIINGDPPTPWEVEALPCSLEVEVVRATLYSEKVPALRVDGDRVETIAKVKFHCEVPPSGIHTILYGCSGDRMEVVRDPQS